MLTEHLLVGRVALVGPPPGRVGEGGHHRDRRVALGQSGIGDDVIVVDHIDLGWEGTKSTDKGLYGIRVGFGTELEQDDVAKHGANLATWRGGGVVGLMLLVGLTGRVTNITRCRFVIFDMNP